MSFFFVSSSKVNVARGGLLDYDSTRRARRRNALPYAAASTQPALCRAHLLRILHIFEAAMLLSADVRPLCRRWKGAGLGASRRT